MRLNNKLVYIPLLLVVPLFAFALKSDHNQPYHISSNASIFYRDQHKAIFTGHVKASQGSSKMQGKKLILHFDKKNKQIIQLTDYGDPATYSTQLENKKNYIDSRAKIIQYFPKKNFVTLSSNAMVTQINANKANNKITSDYITYDLNKQIVSSKPKHKNNKTIITIQPEDTT